MLLVTTIFSAIGVHASDNTDSFSLSKSDKTTKSWSQSRTDGNLKGAFYADHWKGSWQHSDTAKGQITSSSNATKTNVLVTSYKGANVKTASSTDATFVHMTCGYGNKITKINYIFTLSNNNYTINQTVDAT